MKTLTTALWSFTAGFGVAFAIYGAMNKSDNKIEIVWNDDQESIPMDGTPILLEFTDENKVYIGPLD